jgi:predicted MFS family arabinose efflux permease
LPRLFPGMRHATARVMQETAAAATPSEAERRRPWLPLVIIAMGQAQMSLNASALPVSIGGIVAEFNIAPTTVGTAIVAHSIAVAGFTMVGAKLGQKFGSLNVYRVATLMLLASMVMMTFSPSVDVMIAAQVGAGLASAGILPTLVVLIADNYRGRQQATAIGVLGAVQAIAAVAAFFVAGVVGTYFGWRYAFGLMIPFPAIALLSSLRLKQIPKVADVKIDGVGALLAAMAVILISLGVNNFNDWGVVFASALAPISVLGVSPALLMAVAGVIGVQLFIVWAQRRRARAQTPLLALEVMQSAPERAAVLSLMAITALGSALTFVVPLYTEMVQGRTSLATAVAMIPYQLSVFTAAIFVLTLYDRLTPRQIACYAFVLVSAALVLLGVAMNNDWHNLFVILGLVMFGLGQGALVTQLFNVLVTAAPLEFVGDVGSLRGTTRNLAAGVGTALGGALVIAILVMNIERGLADNPNIPPELIKQVDLNRATFVSNERLKDVMANTTATPEQIAEAVRINADARLRALKLSFLLLAGVALLAIIPAGRLPDEVRRKVARRGDSPEHVRPPAE